MNKSDIKNSAIEAIYWWNRSEGYYHKYFKKLDVIYTNKKQLNFFISKLFNSFLNEYSVRRNINKGSDSVNSFIDEIVEQNFIMKVKEGDVRCIDEMSAKLLNSGKSVKKRTISLLSKFAFLINPIDFSLYDTLAREAVWEIHAKGIRKNSLMSYSNFISGVNDLLNLNSQIIKSQQSTLELFEGTEAYDYFSQNNEAFGRRIMDKYLWMYKKRRLSDENQKKDSEMFDNSAYIEFLKM